MELVVALFAESYEISGVVPQVAVERPGFEMVDVYALRGTTHETGRSIAATGYPCRNSPTFLCWGSESVSIPVFLR